MIDPASGPFVFDTSAGSYLNRAVSPAEDLWLDRYFARFPMLVSAVTVVERLRGYALLRQQMEQAGRARVETERQQYLLAIEAGRIRVLPLSTEAAKFGAELGSLGPSLQLDSVKRTFLSGSNRTFSRGGDSFQKRLAGAGERDILPDRR